MTPRWWPLLVVIPLALVACGGEERAQTPEASPTPVVGRPSATAHISLSPTVVPSPTPFPALLPTASPAPTEAAPITTAEATWTAPQYLEGMFVVPADGSGEAVKLAEDGEVDGWSPDGTLIALSTLNPDQSGCMMQPAGCFRDLSVVRADGQGKPLNLGEGRSSTWSGDGMKLLFYRLTRGPFTTASGHTFTGITAKEVCVADAATGETTVLATNGPIIRVDGNTVSTVGSYSDLPAWSPDGSRVLFRFAQAGTLTLYVVRADSSEPPAKVADCGDFCSTDWSPDSQRIVYSSDDFIYIVAADGGEPPRQLGAGHEPHWSPDGSRIAVEVGWLPNSEVWLIDPETSERAKLADGQLLDVWPHSAWSPDGSLLLYERDGVLYAVAPSTGAVRKLGRGEMPVWSPDGKRVAFRGIVAASEDAPGGHGLLVVNADGSGATLLADHLAACIGYDWSPGSQRIAFSSTQCMLI